jgi:hypothetical protein
MTATNRKPRTKLEVTPEDIRGILEALGEDAEEVAA